MDVQAFKTEVSGMTDKTLLRELSHILAVRDAQLTHMDVLVYRVGQKVSFDGGQHHGELTGFVYKVNKKSVGVRVGTKEWRVHPTFLTPAA